MEKEREVVKHNQGYGVAARTPGESRSGRIVILTTLEEKRQLENTARRAGLSLSSWGMTLMRRELANAETIKEA